MPGDSLLGSRNIMAFVATQDARRAKAFYCETLGLRVLSEDRFALALDAHGIMLRVSIVDKVVVAPYTVLGWQVEDAVAATKQLAAAGVKFERFPGLTQDAHGVWEAPGGAKIAW